MSERGLRVLLGAVTRYWRRILIIGVLDVAVGLGALIWPGATVLVLAVLLGVLLLFFGAMALSLGVAGRSPLMAILGLITLVAAMICLFHPGAGVFAILLGCSVWFLLSGLAQLGIAMSGVAGRVWWALLGALSIVAAVIMISSPDIAVVTVALIVGISFLVRGTGELALAWNLRNVHRNVTAA